MDCIKEMELFNAKMDEHLSDGKEMIARLKRMRDRMNKLDKQVDNIEKAQSADDVIRAANNITRMLGGNVKYNSVDEYRQYLRDHRGEVEYL